MHKGLLRHLPATEWAPRNIALIRKREGSTRVNIPEKGDSKSGSFAISGGSSHRANASTAKPGPLTTSACDSDGVLLSSYTIGHFRFS